MGETFGEISKTVSRWRKGRAEALVETSETSCLERVGLGKEHQ